MRQKPNDKKIKEKFDIDESFVVINKESRFQVTEAYKTLRTNIMFTLAEKESCKKIIFTSSIPMEGKTTTCVNSAITFAQIGARVLIIDGDLRRPRVHKHLSLLNEKGLSNVLGGFTNVQNVIQHCEDYNIDCITSGHIPPNPVELLSSAKMQDLLTVLSEQYDYIFLDTPPVTMVTDATAIAKSATGVIIVCRENFTTHDAIQKALSNIEFANAALLGFVLNDAEEVNYAYKKRYSKYGYSKKGRYGSYSYTGSD